MPADAPLGDIAVQIVGEAQVLVDGEAVGGDALALAADAAAGLVSAAVGVEQVAGGVEGEGLALDCCWPFPVLLRWAARIQPRGA
ncbi:hypothetical protein M5C99_06050 [Acidovorax sp. NCPPB 2350]|nr:hypothetical protein M5C99_06050 [Acidovorax sp. NCPPB 2350]